MSKQLNSFILSDDTIKRMKDMLKGSRKNKVEFGFGLCRPKDNNTLIDRGHCIGTLCEIDIGKSCKPDETFAGTYHTHPIGRPYMNMTDMRISCLTHMACVGGGKEDKIKCFVRKDDISITDCYKDMKSYEPQEDLLEKQDIKVRDMINGALRGRSSMIDTLKLVGKHNKDMAEYYRKRWELSNKYFNMINIK